MKLLTLNNGIPQRNYGLDVMRSAAILMVLASHIDHFFEPYFPKIHRSSHFTIHGVELFFALSGFLIGNILIKQFSNQDANLSKEYFAFLRRRWYKTLLVYYLAILVNYITGYFITGYHRDFSFKYLFFLQNFSDGATWFFPAGYSLAIEEWFYILFPLVFVLALALFRKVNRTQLLAIVGALFIVIFIGIRTYVYLETDFHWDSNMRKSLFTRLDCSIYGVLISVYFHRQKQAFEKNRFILLFVGLIIYTICTIARIKNPDGYLNNVLLFSFIPLSFSLAIPFFFHLQTTNRFLIRTFTCISLVSFAVYLIHLSPLLELFDRITLQKDLFFDFGAAVIYLTLTGIIGVLWYKYIEQPITNLRDRE
jgi:peptidoglycan/LPS O-acetylase OafA/YrhL